MVSKAVLLRQSILAKLNDADKEATRDPELEVHQGCAEILRGDGTVE